MDHQFMIADRKVNGQFQTTFDNNSGQAVVVGWDIPPENIPRFQPGKCAVTIKAAEATLVPSIWKAFGGAANVGLNSLTNKLNSVFGGMNPTANEPAPDYQQPFRPIEVHTGIKVIIPRDEILVLSSPQSCFKNGLVLVGNTIIDPDRGNDEITVWVYNILSTDITLQRGDDIAVGYFTKVIGAMVGGQVNPDYGRPTPIPSVDLNKN